MGFYTHLCGAAHTGQEFHSEIQLQMAPDTTLQVQIAKCQHCHPPQHLMQKKTEILIHLSLLIPHLPIRGPPARHTTAGIPQVHQNVMLRHPFIILNVKIISQVGLTSRQETISNPNTNESPIEQQMIQNMPIVQIHPLLRNIRPRTTTTTLIQIKKKSPTRITAEK